MRAPDATRSANFAAGIAGLGGCPAGRKDKREKGLSLNESGKAAVGTTERNNSLWSSLNSTKAILSARSIKGRARSSSPTPGTRDRRASVKAVCAAIAKPFNFMAGIPGKSFTVAGLEAAGVRRISLAGSLYRAAMGGLVVAARELKDKGTFGYVDTAALPSAELAGFMRE